MLSNSCPSKCSNTHIFQFSREGLHLPSTTHRKYKISLPLDSEWTKTWSLTRLGVLLLNRSFKKGGSKDVVFLFLESPARVPWWMGGPWYFTDVCACVCGSMSVLVTADLLLDFYERAHQIKRRCRFHLTTTTCEPEVCLHTTRGRVPLPANQHFQHVTQRQDPAGLHLLTKPILQKSHLIPRKSPVAPL